MTHKIISRKQAAKQGLDTYYTGRLCKNGHIALRTVKDYYCTDCTTTKAARERKALVAKHGEDGALRILRDRWKANAQRHRDITTREQRAEYMRNYMQRYRATQDGYAKTERARKRYEQRLKEAKHEEIS